MSCPDGLFIFQSKLKTSFGEFYLVNDNFILISFIPLYRYWCIMILDTFSWCAVVYIIFIDTKIQVGLYKYCMAHVIN